MSAHVDVEPYVGQPVNHPQYNCKETRDKPEFANETIGNAVGVQNTPMLYGTVLNTLTPINITNTNPTLNVSS